MNSNGRTKIPNSMKSRIWNSWAKRRRRKEETNNKGFRHLRTTEMKRWSEGRYRRKDSVINRMRAQMPLRIKHTLEVKTLKEKVITIVKWGIKKIITSTNSGKHLISGLKIWCIDPEIRTTPGVSTKAVLFNITKAKTFLKLTKMTK